MIAEGAQPFFLPGGKQGILLIHGFTGAPAEMLLLGEFLHGHGFTVLGVRLAGHGTTPEDLSVKTAEDWLDSVRDGYAILSGYAEKIFLVGHSMGGLCALLLAEELKAAKVVSLAAPIYIHPARGIEHLPPASECAGLYIPKMRRRLTDVPPAVNKTYRKMPLSGVHEILNMIDAVKKKLDKLKMPLLIAHGRGDHTADPRSAEYILAHAGSERKEIFWLEDMGHLLPILPGREFVFTKTAKFLLS